MKGEGKINLTIIQNFKINWLGIGKEGDKVG